MKTFFTSRWPYLWVCLAPLLLFAPFLLGGRVLYWGAPLLQFYPWRWLAWASLSAGRWPGWNPYVGNGAPLLANLQSAVFYPPNWLGLVAPLEYAQSWLVALHCVWAGLGMVSLARALGFKPLGQAVAGLAFGLSQYLVGKSLFFSLSATVAWAPWIIWAVEQGRPGAGAARRGWPWPLWLTLFLALQLLAGHAQTAWYSWLLMGLWWLWAVVTGRWPLRLPPLTVPVGWVRRGVNLAGALVRAGLPLAGCLGLALGLTAIQWLPTAELLRESPRAASAAYDFVMTYSFSPWRLLTLFAPDLLGNPARSGFNGYGNYWEDAIYIGLLPVLLAGGVLAQKVRGGIRRWQGKPLEGEADPGALPVFLLGLGGLSLLLALGRNTPVFPFLYRYVPTFNMFQSPARMLVWLEFALALLAGLGADAWQPARGKARRWLNRGLAGAGSVLLTGGLVYVWLPAGFSNAALLRTAAGALVGLGLGLGVTILLALTKPPAASLGWSSLAAACLTADLLWANWGLNPAAPADLYQRASASGPALRSALGSQRLYRFPADEYHVKYEILLSFKTFGPLELAYATRAAQLANVALLDGLYSANNFEPLVSARYAGFMTVVSETQSVKLLQLMDVGALASSQPRDWEVLASGGPATFYRVPGVSRRVRVVYAARVVSDTAAALAALAAPAFDPDVEVILEPPPSSAWPQAFPGLAFLTSLADPVTIPVTLRQVGWVVLADTYYPGWAAWVDDRPAPILPADGAFRAVAVPAGEHVITFRYAPASFFSGAGVSGLAGLVGLALALAARFIKKDRSAQPVTGGVP